MTYNKGGLGKEAQLSLGGKHKLAGRCIQDSEAFPVETKFSALLVRVFICPQEGRS